MIMKMIMKQKQKEGEKTYSAFPQKELWKKWVVSFFLK